MSEPPSKFIDIAMPPLNQPELEVFIEKLLESTTWEDTRFLLNELITAIASASIIAAARQNNEDPTETLKWLLDQVQVYLNASVTVRALDQAGQARPS